MTTSKKVLTLCIIHRDQRVLLGMKKKGFGQGRWNGFGGKVEAGESIEEAATRECQEEAGIIPEKMRRVGTLLFMFPRPQLAHEVYIFSASSFTGAPRETAEMQPRWFSVDDIPYNRMWPDDRHWLPLLLAGKSFTGSFTFDSQDAITKYAIIEQDKVSISYAQ